MLLAMSAVNCVSGCGPQVFARMLVAQATA